MKKGRRGRDPKDQPVNVDQLLAEIRGAHQGRSGKPTAPKTPRKEMSAKEKKRREEQRQAVLDGRMDKGGSSCVLHTHPRLFSSNREQSKAALSKAVFVYIKRHPSGCLLNYN